MLTPSSVAGTDALSIRRQRSRWALPKSENFVELNQPNLWGETPNLRTLKEGENERGGEMADPETLGAAAQDTDGGAEDHEHEAPGSHCHYQIRPKISKTLAHICNLLYSSAVR